MSSRCSSSSARRSATSGPGGKILNVASTAGITSRPGWLAYASSKAAVVSLSATLADELAGSGHQDLQHLARPDGHRAAPQAGAGGGPDDDHAAGPGGRRHRPADERRRGHPGRPEHHRPHAGLAGGCAALEYRLASVLLRLVRPVRSRARRSSPTSVVLATARVTTLDGNLLHLHRSMTARHPELAVRPPARAVQLRPARQAAPTSSGSSAGCTTSRPRACSSSTTPTCRSMSRRIGGDDGRPGLARGGGAQTVRAGHDGADRGAGADVPPSLLRRGRRRWGVGARAVCGRAPDADRAGHRPGRRRGPTCSSTTRRWRRRASGCWRRIPSSPGGGWSSTPRRSVAAASASGRPPGSTPRRCGRPCLPATRWS